MSSLLPCKYTYFIDNVLQESVILRAFRFYGLQIYELLKTTIPQTIFKSTSFSKYPWPA